MPSFRTGEVLRLLDERPGLQRVEVDLGDGPERAYVLTQLTGTVAPTDPVVVNTTAVELGLGTGGWHVVHWNLSRAGWSEKGPGHIIKGRYTSLQADVGSTEEHLAELAEVEAIDGMPVVAAALHSQLPAVAVAVKERMPDARLAYVMTDGAGLPLALSDLVAELRERELVDATVTYGHTFGGDYEAVSIFSALAVARHVARRRRRRRRDGAGNRGHQHPARFQRDGDRAHPRRRGRAGWAAGRVPAGVVRRSPRAPPRPVAPQPDGPAPRGAASACRSQCRCWVSPRTPSCEPSSRPPASTAATTWSTSCHPTCSASSPATGSDVESMGRTAVDDSALFLAGAAAGVLAADLAAARTA